MIHISTAVITTTPCKGKYPPVLVEVTKSILQLILNIHGNRTALHSHVIRNSPLEKL